jgi:RNA polymerase sigma-70 factor (ECF subfamily)
MDVEDRVAQALQRGDRSGAVTDGLRGYGGQLVSYLRSILGDGDAALEVYAQFCENAWKSIDHFKQGSFRAWLYRLAYCAAQDYRRDPYRGRTRRLLSGEVSGMVAAARSSLRPDRQHEKTARLEAVLAHLDDGDRTLVVLRVARGMAWKDVAAVLDLDEAAARKRFQRLKDRVRDLLQA